MNCEEARRAILPLLYDELEPAEKRDVGSHLATCDGCAALLAEERRLLALLDRPVVEPAEELLQRCRRDLMDALAGATIAAGAGGAGARPGRPTIPPSGGSWFPRCATARTPACAWTRSTHCAAGPATWRSARRSCARCRRMSTPARG